MRERGAIGQRGQQYFALAVAEFDAEQAELMENAKNSKEDAKKKQNDIEEIKKTLEASDDSGSKLQEELRTSLEAKEQMSADYHGFFQKQEEISKRCNDLDKEIFRLNKWYCRNR